MLDSDRYWEPDIECMPRSDLDALQAKKLFEVVAWAYERAPLVRDAWERAGVTPDDIDSLVAFRQQVPFIDKDSMRHFRDERHDPYGGMLAIDLATPGVFGAIFSTSGTTGDPTLAPFPGREGPPILGRGAGSRGARPRRSSPASSGSSASVPATTSSRCCSPTAARPSTGRSAAS